MTKVLALRERGQGEGYPRGDALLAAARAAGCEVTELAIDVPASGRAKQRIAKSPWTWPGFFVRLLAARRRAVRAIRREVEHQSPDMVLVLYPGHAIVRWARKAFSGRIVLDLFLSAHDTVVLDHQRFHPKSPFAAWLKHMDVRACAAADLVLLDTKAHAERIAALTGSSRERFDHVPVSDVDSPKQASPYQAQRPGEKLEVLFFGTGVPLHGLSTLLSAVERVPGVRLTLVGGTSEDRERAARLPAGRIRLLGPFLGRSRLDELIMGAHLVAGVFGTSLKADLVVPLKVMHALSHGRPVLTGDSTAVRQLMTVGVDVLVTERGDAMGLADCLASLLGDPGRLSAMAKAARARYETTFSIAATAQRFCAALEARFSDVRLRRPVAATLVLEPALVP